MNIYKLLFRAFTLVSFVLIPSLGYSVTKEEMDQARTIAAKSYLRYANDGSGYLDDLNPKTMEELEAALKTKEKENIKAFKAIPVPENYNDWDKDKLVEYWAVTAFQNKGLLEKGRGGRIRARSQINKMSIAAPQPKTAETTSAPVQTSSSNKADDDVAGTDAIVNTQNEINGLEAAENALQSNQEFEDDELNIEKAYNYTWVYIMILAILVALVIALVVYAANVLKKNGAGNEPRNPVNQDISGLQEELEHYKTLVSDKDVEIAMIKKKLETALRQNSELKGQLDAAASDIREPKISRPTVDVSHNKAMQTNVDLETRRPAIRSIYLGRANQRGIFVRADKTLNVGHSLYVLTTSDGYSGSFKIADTPAAWSLALSNPAEYLEHACTGYDLGNTSMVSRIVTEANGSAVFEGGCWRVVRKAKIRYEKD